MTAAAKPTPGLEEAAERAESRRGLLLALPSYLYLIVFFAMPLAIIGVYSFASRSRVPTPSVSTVDT